MKKLTEKPLREALVYANSLLDRFTSMTPRTMSLGRLPFTELHDETTRYLEAITKHLGHPERHGRDR